MAGQSQVGGIIKALSSMEGRIDDLDGRVAEYQKSIGSAAQSEIESLREKTRQMASKEAESAIAAARTGAEAEAASIAEKAEAGLAETRSKIDASFDEAVDAVVSAVLKA